jgi:fatty-acyl-CoA synthase
MTKKGEDPAKIRISATTLGDMLLTAWDKVPDKLAMVFPSQSVTYDQLVTNAMQRARGLVALGVKPGDHVGILLPSGIAFIETLFGVAMTGAVSVLMNARYRSPELAYVAENADLTIIITNDEIDDHVNFVERLTEALPDRATLPKLRHLILLGGNSATGFIDQAVFDAAAATVSEAQIHQTRLSVRLRDTCMILYTSGTSANPKGCLLSHEAIVREVINIGHNRWEFDESDRIWSPMPLFHIAALLAMLAAIDAGGTFFGQPHFDPGESLRQIEQDRPTMLFLPFVTFYQAMIAHPDFEKTDMSSIRLMNSCFVMMPKSVSDAFRRKAPNALQCGTYGMTEISGIGTTGGYGMDPELGFSALGFPMAGVSIKIANLETGAALPAGERGEIVVKGYNLLDGYYRDPEKTAAAFTADGAFRTGDIGSFDVNGHLMFHGRFKDMLKVGGENVAAAEVEAVLAKHPAVRLAQVVGIPDDRLAEVPAAFIERNGGPSATEEELIAFVKTQIAGFKVPRHVRFVDEWPMSASKIQKFKLRQSLCDELGIQA